MSGANDSEWVELDDVLSRACEAMACGQLVHAESFNLFEAMSAVECGNPKMDSAVAAARCPLPSIDDLLASGIAPVADLEAAQLVAVLDQLIVLEAGWLDGSSLAQTVYTCLYMLRPERLAENKMLAAYCQALRATVVAVRALMVLGGVAEEEDCAYHVSGLPLDDGATGSGTSSADGMDQVVAALDAAIASCSDAQVDSAQLGSESERAAIQLRLKYRRQVHQGLTALDKATRDLPAAMRHFAAARELVQQIRGGAATSTSSSTTATKASPSSSPEQVPTTPPAADAVASSSNGGGGSSSSGSAGQAPGCHSNVNRHLLGPSPPRVVRLMAHGQACEWLATMLQHLQRAVQLASVTSYRSLQSSVQQFAGLNASALPRSVAHYLLLPKAWEKETTAHSSTAKASKGATAATATADVLPPCVPGRDMIAAAIGLPTPLPFATAAPSTAGSSAPAAPANHGGGASTASNALENGASVEPGSSASPSSSAVAAPAAASASSGLPVPGPELDLFLEQATIAVSNWVQALLMNRSRQRRRLRRGLEDWSNLYEHGVNADVSPDFAAFIAAAGWQWPAEDEAGQYTQGLLGAWVESQSSLCVVQHLMMGFNLELYLPHEFAMMYWYCDYLLATVQHTAAMLSERHPLVTAVVKKQEWEQQQHEQQQQQQQQAGSKGPRLARRGGKGGKGGGKSGGGGGRSAAAPGSNGAVAAANVPPPAAADVQFPVTFEELFMQMQEEQLSVDLERSLCQAMIRLLLALTQAGLLKTPYGTNTTDAPFNAEVNRFEQRFAILHTLLRPEPLFYDQYVQMVQAAEQHMSAPVLLGQAAELLAKARKTLSIIASHSSKTLSGDALAEAQLGWRALDRVAVHNSIAINVLLSGLAASNPLVVTFDLTHHPKYPVISVKGRKAA